MRTANDFAETTYLHDHSTRGGPKFEAIVAAAQRPHSNTAFHYDNTVSDRELKPISSHSGKIVMGLNQSPLSHIVGTSELPSNARRRGEGAWWSFGSSNDPDRQFLVLNVAVSEPFAKTFLDYASEWSNAWLKLERPTANEANDLTWSTLRIPLQPSTEWNVSSSILDVTVSIPGAMQEEINGFAVGIRERKPESVVVESAERIARVAVEYAVEPDITMDIDGELSFYMRLKSGHLIMAEMSISGSIDVSIFDENDQLLKRIPYANEREFVEVLRL